MPALLCTLVAIFVMAWLAASWPELWRAPRLLRRRGVVLGDSELGLAQVTLPAGWMPATDLNDGAWLQALDPLRNRYLVVISESREDFDPAMNLQEHSSRTREALAASVRVLAVRGPEERTVGGFPALQYELDALMDRTLLTYLHTTVEGRRAFHQVLTWATRSWYDRAVFEGLLDGFTEQQGPDPRPQPMQVTPLEVPVASRYDVH
jgi:dihydrofolate reductase